MRIGFVGSRAGPSSEQRAALRGILSRLNVGLAVVLHHEEGDPAASLAGELGLATIAYPEFQVYQGYAREHRKSRAVPTRNLDIVDNCDILIVCPSHACLPTFGRMASLVEYARKHGKPRITIWPNGSTLEEKPA